MRALGYALSLSLAASTAQADDALIIDCQRYESKCTGEKCRVLSEGLRQDTDKEILTLQHMEKVRYEIRSTDATATFMTEDPDGKMVRLSLRFATARQTDHEIILENRTDDGAVKERVSVEKSSGFYSKFLLHTDNSLKDVPLGEPYNAYFGWCEEVPEAEPNPA